MAQAPSDSMVLGNVIHGDVDADGKHVVLYVIKADQTSYINYIKPLILASELGAAHVLSIIDTKDDWYFKIHPQRMVPALKDRDPKTGDDIIVFESTACLQYLSARYDEQGMWTGRTLAEKGSVFAWTAYQTAALGPTAKYWLYFLRGYPNRQSPVQLPRTIEQLHKDTIRQWDILEKRLAEPGQQYIALKDRPTIADISYLPFSMPYMFTLFGAFLSQRHKVKRLEDGSLLPSEPFIFPNGQGDSAKFLSGIENSRKWESSHGPIYRIWSGMTPEIVVSSPEHVQQLFKDSDRHLKAKNNNSGYVFSQLLGQCIGLLSQNEWKRLRATFEPSFSRSAGPRHTAMVMRRTMQYLGDLSMSVNLQKGLIDPGLDLKYLPFHVIANVLYGDLTVSLERDLNELGPLRESLFQDVIQGGVVTRYSWARFIWPFSPVHRKLSDFQSRWASFNQEAYSNAAKSGYSPGSQGAPPILAIYQAVEKGEITRDHMLHTLDEILFANLDVTIGGVSWNLVFLAAYPECQTKLRAEIQAKRDSAKTQAGSGNASELFEKYLLDSQSYLSACISESSRLRPLASFTVAQAVPEPRQVGGYLFPAGTNFIVDTYALNHRNGFWGDDSLLFRPERIMELNTVRARYNFWRFGFGPRQCMGKHIADLILRTLLVCLLEKYELRLQESAQEEWQRDPNCWINHPQMLLRCEKLDVPTDRTETE